MPVLPDGTIENLRHRPRSPADEFTFRLFGGPTRRRVRLVSVGTTPTVLLENDPNRVHWWISNYAAAELTVNWTPEIVNGVGILIGGNGGFLEQLIREDGNAVGDEVYGIIGAGSQNVFVYDVAITHLIQRG